MTPLFRDQARRMRAQLPMTWQTVTTLTTPFTIDGRDWHVRVEGAERDDGTWAGRIVFVDGSVIRTTDRETSQPNRDALAYWATGLEQVFLEGALQRAR
jgi:hypothetical protein